MGQLNCFMILSNLKVNSIIKIWGSLVEENYFIHLVSVDILLILCKKSPLTSF